eukprot:COSAG01_NODE_55324_length_326_cov_0.511013_1_plen_77_part_01
MVSPDIPSWILVFIYLYIVASRWATVNKIKRRGTDSNFGDEEGVTVGIIPGRGDKRYNKCVPSFITVGLTGDDTGGP